MINSYPLVSVCLITYNHVEYIEQTLESIFSQEVNFPWELVIADDCSNDGTRDKILEYKNRYPGLVRLILQEKNVGASRNWLDLILSSKSKYIAYIEGDDYWTDPLKLKKQVSYLETHHNCALCFHRVKALVENDLAVDTLIEERYRKVINKDKITTMDLLAQGNFIHSCSIVFRNNIIKFPYEFSFTSAGDYFLFILLSEKGYLYRIDDYMGVYRRGSGSYSSLSPIEMQKKIIQYHIAILSYLSNEEQRKIFLPKTIDAISVYETLILNQKYQKELVAKHTGLKDLIRILVSKISQKISIG